MQYVKCLKCNWRGSSVDTQKQWFHTDTGHKEYDAITEEILMICPECKDGLCVWDKRRYPSGIGDLIEQVIGSSRQA